MNLCFLVCFFKPKNGWLYCKTVVSAGFPWHAMTHGGAKIFTEVLDVTANYWLQVDSKQRRRLPETVESVLALTFICVVRLFCQWFFNRNTSFAFGSGSSGHSLWVQSLRLKSRKRLARGIMHDGCHTCQMWAWCHRLVTNGGAQSLISQFPNLIFKNWTIPWLKTCGGVWVYVPPAYRKCDISSSPATHLHGEAARLGMWSFFSYKSVSFCLFSPLPLLF